MQASAGGHTETVEMLLERGATVDLPANVRNMIHSCTSCMCVCMRLLTLGEGSREEKAETSRS